MVLSLWYAWQSFIYTHQTRCIQHIILLPLWLSHQAILVCHRLSLTRCVACQFTLNCTLRNEKQSQSTDIDSVHEQKIGSEKLIRGIGGWRTELLDDELCLRFLYYTAFAYPLDPFNCKVNWREASIKPLIYQPKSVFGAYNNMSIHVEMPLCLPNGVTQSRKIDDKTFAQQVLCIQYKNERFERWNELYL